MEGGLEGGFYVALLISIHCPDSIFLVIVGADDEGVNHGVAGCILALDAVKGGAGGAGFGVDEVNFPVVAVQEDFYGQGDVPTAAFPGDVLQVRQFVEIVGYAVVLVGDCAVGADGGDGQVVKILFDVAVVKF